MLGTKKKIRNPWSVVRPAACRYVRIKSMNLLIGIRRSDVPLFALGDHICHTAAKVTSRQDDASRPPPQDMPSEEVEGESSPTLSQPPVSPLPEDVHHSEARGLAGRRTTSPVLSTASPEGLRRRVSSRSQADTESVSTNRRGSNTHSISSSPSTSAHKTLAEMEQDEEPESGYVTLLK